MDKNTNINTAPDTVVGPSVKIQGDLNSQGNIKVDGHVTGKINTSESVQVGQAAIIIAEINAGNAIVAGEVQGNIKVNSHLILQSTARIRGDISCAVLRIEDGAQFSGKCNMSAANGKKVQPEPEE